MCPPVLLFNASRLNTPFLSSCEENSGTDHALSPIEQRGQTRLMERVEENCLSAVSIQRLFNPRRTN